MAELQDPLSNRVVKSSPTPYQKSITHDNVFTSKTVNWILMRDFLRREGKLEKKILLEVIKRAQTIFSNCPLIQGNSQT